MPTVVEQINLLGLDGAALTDLVGQWGGKPFRARQLERWIHQRSADSFDQMTDLARDFRLRLAQRCSIHAPRVLTEQKSTDGTRKWLRSEEHTSELQSLMRISYAVFCLKKKTRNLTNLNINRKLS